MDKDKLMQVLSKLRLSVGIHQLQEPVPIEIQAQYYMRSREVREAIEDGSLLLDEERLIEEVEAIAGRGEWYELCHICPSLAATNSIRVLRFIEGLLPELEGEPRYWALMAQLELRMRVVDSLVDEQQVVISSGLGGRGELIRLNGYCISATLAPWEPYQRDILSRELADACQKAGGEVEQEVWGDGYLIYTVLLPYHLDMAGALRGFIHQANVYGGFIHPECHVTNMEQLTHEHVMAHIDRIRQSEQPEESETMVPDDILEILRNISNDDDTKL